MIYNEPRRPHPARALQRILSGGATRTGSDNQGESGAILILALVYIIVVSVTVLALASWATNDLSNTTHFNSYSGLQNAASSLTNTAIQSVRHYPIPTTMPTQDVATGQAPCWGSGATYSELSVNSGSSGNPVTYTVGVWCSTLENLSSSSTRIVTFSTCQLTSRLLGQSNPAAACAARPLLQAVVSFDDYPPQGSSKLTSQCNLIGGGTSCGQGMTLENWNWGGQLVNYITITSTAPGNAVVGGTQYVPTAIATSGDVVSITSGTSSVCTFASGAVSYVADGTCTLDFNDAGSGSYSAANQVTQSFFVGLGTQATLVVTSTNGSHTAGLTLTTSGGSGTGAVTYAVVNGTATGCSIVAGVLKATTSGTCKVTATKAADANYNATSSAQTTVTLS